MRNASAPAPSLTRRKLYIAMVAVSQLVWAGQSYSSPEGGQVVGGAGKIDQSDKETVIHQQTDRMAIDWQSFDVKADERVQFVQPSASSLALNRVVSNKGSQILGRIEANGQVLLVNPNGVVFGKDSQINVGGILASGLTINPTDFMNGNFTLSEVEGTAGKVVNSGIINAATGGSVTLLGKEVTNDGLIIANLGAVNLAVGKEAVVTFESNGLVGVKVTKEVLQNELGVDAALINSGEINAEGGRILLTASTSQDIFSQAVNHEGMNASTSVVVNEDGSFTLGGGADVVNTGKISTNATNGNAGQIVVVGDKITNIGVISADSQVGNGGHIELNSKDTTILNQTSNVSAQSFAAGKGGDVKILGDKVGLMDTASVNASGANGGGQILIGGDETGKNKSINNANFIYLGENTNVKTDALLNGNGGKLITFARDTARIYGNLSARSENGNGGFIETSGLKGFEILNTPDISAQNGLGGTWLIDPYDLTISVGGGQIVEDPSHFFTSTNTLTNINIDTLERALKNGATVNIVTGTSGNSGSPDQGNVTLSDDLNYNARKISGGNQFSNSSAKSTLIISAANKININADIIRDPTNSDASGNLTLVLNANNGAEKFGSGSIIIAAGKKIETSGGDFTSNSQGFDSSAATINTSSTDHTGGGDIKITSTGSTNDVKLGALKFGYTQLSPNETIPVDRIGTVDVNSDGKVVLASDIEFNNTGARNSVTGTRFSGTNASDNPELKITAVGDITIDGSIFDLYGDARDALDIKLKSTGPAGVIIVNKAIYTSGGDFTAESSSFISTALIDTDHANDGAQRVNGNLTSADATWSNGGNITISASSSIALGDLITDASATASQVGNARTGNLIIQGINKTSGTSIDNVSVSQTASKTLSVAGTTTFNVGGGDIILGLVTTPFTLNSNKFTGAISFLSANDVKIKNDQATVLGTSKIDGTFDLTSTGAITQTGNVVVADVTTIDAANQSVNLGGDNDFGTINFSNPITNLTLKDINALTLGGVVANGTTNRNVNVSAGGLLTTGSINTSTNANNASAGQIILTGAGGIALGGNLTAKGGTNGTGTAGSGGKIELKNNVTLLGPVTIDTSGPTSRGNISFSGNIYSPSSSTRNLSLTGNTITFNGNVGDNATNRIGVFTVDSTADFGANAKSFYTTSFDLTAQNIFANVLDSFGGTVKLKGTNAVTVNEISAQGIATDQAGGNVTIDGADITLGNANNVAVDTAGNGAGLAGDVKIIATKNGTPSITIKGDINSGAKVAELTLLGANVTAGKVDLGSYSLASGFTSSLLITGSAGADMIIGNSIENTWDISAATNKTIKKTGSSAAPYITYINFENLSGGTLADTFDITSTFTGTINGGNGENIFKIGAGATKVTGGIDKDTFNITTGAAITIELDGGNATTDTINAFNGPNQWALGSTESLNGAIKFSNIEILNGGNKVDEFTFTGTNASSRTIDAGDDDDIVNVQGDTTINFSNTSLFFSVQHAEIIKSINGGKLTAVSADWLNWNFSDTGSYVGIRNLNDGTTDSTTIVKFLNFNSFLGGNGNDTFIFSEAARVNDLIDGGGGTNTLNLIAATGDISVEIKDTDSLSDLTVNRFSKIDGNNSASSTLISSASGGSTWNISGSNSGSVNGITFTDFKNLTGGTGADIFRFSTLNSSITGSISGGTGAGQNEIIARSGVDVTNTWKMKDNTSGSLEQDSATPETYAKFLNIQKFTGAGFDTMSYVEYTNGDAKVQIGSTTSGASGMTAFIGNGTLNSEIIGADGPNNWQITGANKGKVGAINFEGFNKLTGGAAKDDFTITSTGSFVGTINGGNGGLDTLTRAGNTAASWILDTLTAKAGSLGTTLFTNISSIFGSGSDSLTGRNQANDWTLSGDKVGNVHATGNTSDQITFSGFNKVIGLAGVDSFNITSADALSVSVDGGTGADNKLTKSYTGSSAWIIDGLRTGTLDGNRFTNISEIVGTNDTLTGRNQANEWTLSGNKNGNVHLAGAVTTDQITFSGINKVIGLAGIDTFTLTSANALSITVDGGGVGNKLVRTYGGAATWQLGGAHTGTLGAMTFSNIGEIIGNEDDTIIGRNQANNWSISGAGVGFVQEAIASPTDKIIFSKISALKGNVLADSFVIEATGSVTDIDAVVGTGENNLTSNVSNSIFAMTGANNGSLNSTISFKNIQKIIGGSTTDTLIGNSSVSLSNEWTIDATNKLTSTNGSIEFSGIETLQGNDGKDTFIFNTDYSGNAKGGKGADIFNIYAFVKTLWGEDGDDTFNLFSSGQVETINGGINTNTLKTITSTANTWILSAANKGSLNKEADNEYVSSFDLIQTIQGSVSDSLTGINQSNTWIITGPNQGVLAATNSSNSINFSGMGKLIGGSGSDLFDFSVPSSAVTIGVDGGDTQALSNTIKSHANIQDEWTMTGLTSGSLAVKDSTNPYIPLFTNIQRREATGDIVVTGYVDLSQDYDGSDEIRGTNTSGSIVIGFNQNNVWNITGSNSGTITFGNKTVAFSRFANLTGGKQNDQFNFTSNGIISGVVSGGGVDENAGAINSIVGLNDTANAWRLIDTKSGEVTAAGASGPYVKFQNIQKITGGNRVDTLYGITTGDASTKQNWQLNGNNENIFFLDNPNAAIKFTAIENIEGGVGVNKLINTSASQNWVITDANHGAVNSIVFSKINTIEGSGSDSLTGRNQENNWQITSDGGGTLSQNNFVIDDTLNFSKFSKLIGGSGIDIFTFGETGTVQNVDGGGSPGDSNNTIVSKLRANSWIIEPNGASRLFGNNIGPVNFTNISNLTGGAGFADAFDIANISAVKGIIDGGAGTNNTLDLTKIVAGVDVKIGVGASAIADLRIANITQVTTNGNNNNTLIADNLADNIFKITGANTGTLNSGLTFNGIANLSGRDTKDSFIFDGASAKLSGKIDGGLGEDILDLLKLGANSNVVILNDNLAPVANAINVTNVDILSASNSFVNTLTGNDKKNTWTITSTDTGTFTNGDIAVPITFSNFSILVGGQKDDLFEFQKAGKLSRYIDGGLHENSDVVDLSKLAGKVDIALGTLNQGYRRIERFIGNNLDSTLYGDNSNNIWNLTGANTGSVNGTIAFSNFTALVGGDGEDTFYLTEGSLSGSVYGGKGKDTFNISNAIIDGSLFGDAGDDTLNATISGSSAETTRFVGGADNNIVNVLSKAGDTSSYLATHGAAVANGGVLRYDVNTTTRSVNYSGVKEVNDLLVADTLTIEGTDAADIFNLSNNSYLLNNLTTVNYQNKNNLTVAGAVNDKVSIAAPITIPNLLTLKKVSVETLNNGVIRANGLLLDGASSVGSSSNRLQTNIANLSVNTSAGDIYIQEQNALNISSFTSNNKVDLLLDGNLTSDVPLASIAQFNVSTSGNITLDKENALTGELNLKTSKNIVLKNSTGTIFGNINADVLTVNSVGSILGNGIINVGGIATLGSGLDITLENAQNDFNSVSITNAQNVSLVDSNLLTLSTVGATGNIKTQSQGIILNGAINGGSLSINAGGGSANLANTIAAQSNVDITAQTITVAGNIDARANVKATSVGDFTHSANISGGSVELNVGRYIANSGTITATNGSVSITSASDISTKNISASTDIILKAANDLSAGGALSTSNGIIDLLAGRNVILSNDVNGQAGVNVAATNGSVQLQAALKSAKGDVNVKTVGDIIMAANATTSASEGNISYAGKNLTVTALSALNGEVTFNSTGSVNDANADLINISAKKFTVDAFSGIGASDDLETNVAGLSLASQTGGIRIINTGDVTIDRMRANNNIYFSNYKGDVFLDNSENPVFGRAESDALLAGGTMNSNYNLSDLFIRIDSGDLLMAPGYNKSKEMPAIVANNAKIDIAGGNFGSLGSPIIVYVRGDFVYTASRYTKPLWAFGIPPANPVKGPGVQTSLIDLLSAGAEQLVVVEEINQINPAIFTNVRNYVYDDIAIMLPADQRYDDSVSSTN